MQIKPKIHTDNIDRALDAYEMRSDGKSFSEIATYLNVGEVRAKQLVFRGSVLESKAMSWCRGIPYGVARDLVSLGYSSRESVKEALISGVIKKGSRPHNMPIKDLSFFPQARFDALCTWLNVVIPKKRVTPNPNSQLLANAVVGGAGLEIPPNAETPEGMAVVILYVPINAMLGKNPSDIQADLGLPWHQTGGQSIWFDELNVEPKNCE